MAATKTDRLRAANLEAEGHRHHLVERLRALGAEAYLQADIVAAGSDYHGSRQIQHRIRAVEEGRVLLEVACEAIASARTAGH